MPIAPAVIAALIGAATTATEIGLQASGAFSPGTPKTAPAATGPTVDQTKALIAPQALSIEQATGGSVSPDYLSTIAPVLAGVGGQKNTPQAMQQIIQQMLGRTASGGGSGSPSTGGGTAPFTPTGTPVNLSALASTPGFSDFLSKIAGGV